MELSTSFNPDRTLKMQTPGAQAGPVAAGPSFLQGLDPNLISQLLNAKLARNAPQVQASAPRETAYPSEMPARAPQLGAAPLRPTRAALGDPAEIPRFSYAFNPHSQAGTAPVLPTMIGRGREGVDFIMEGGPQNWTGAPRAEKRAPRFKSYAQTQGSDGGDE